MEQTQSPKITKTYSCEKCNYSCGRQSEYNRHLLTLKHNREQTEQTQSPKITKQFTCDCGKTYKVSSGLWKHKKKCSLIMNSIVIQENQREQPSLMDIIMQNKEIMDMLVLQNKEKTDTIKEKTDTIKEQSETIKEQSETIRELIPKIGSNNNNNNNTTNNQFNLQVFLNEDCKDAMNFSEFIEQFKLSFKDLENQAELGYVKGITKLFIDNLQGLGKHKRPIHCTDKKRKTLYIKEKNEWDKEGSHDILEKGIQDITCRTHTTLMKEKNDRPEEYSDMDSEFSQNCLTIQGSIIPVAPRETSFGKVVSNISEQTTIEESQKTLM